MLPKRKNHFATEGATRVLGCCTFTWNETRGRRFVVVHDGAHDTCLGELERAARSQGLHLCLIRRGRSP